MSTNLTSRDASIARSRTAGLEASLHVDARDGALLTRKIEAGKRTYSAATTITTAASATDILTIAGAADKRIEIQKITIGGVQTTAGMVAVNLILRSTANTAGTSAAVTAAKHEVADAAPSAVVTAYSANASALGTSAGTVRALRVPIGVAAAAAIAPTTIEFGESGKPIVLAAALESLAVNLGGVTVTGGSLDVNIEWTESTSSAS